MARKWLQKAIKKEGWTTKWCKQQGYSEVNCACIRKLYNLARRKKDRTLLGRAMVAARANGGCGITKGDIAKWAKKRKRSTRKRKK